MRSPAAEPGDDLHRGLALVVFVHGYQRPLQAHAREQLAGVAGVFAGDGVGQPEYMQRAQRQVGHVADGRGHHVQRAGRVGLARGQRGPVTMLENFR